MFEYMASGRPIVASNLPAIKEILHDKNAVLVRPDDPDSLAEGIKSIIDNRVLAEEISQKSRFDAENYTWQKRVDKILNFSKS